MSNETPVLYNADVERALIGAALYTPDVLELLSAEPGDFYIERHRQVWDALRAMQRGGMDIDLTTLTELLSRRGQLADVGGPAYLTQCLASAPGIDGAQGYERIVLDYAARRRAMQAAQSLAAACYQLDKPLLDAILRTVDAILHQAGNVDPQPVEQIASAVYDSVMTAHENPQDVWGVATGFRDIDKLIHGLRYGEVTYLIGKPGGGKSKLALQIALNAARDGTAVAYYSLEMPQDDLLLRAASALAETPTVALMTGKADAAALSRFAAACDRLARRPLYILDKPTLSVGELSASVQRMARRYGVRLVVIDYIQLLGLPSWQVRNRSEYEIQDEITRQVKWIARAAGVAILAIGSVIKSGMDDSEASMTHLRGGGASIHHADVICELLTSRDVAGTVDLVFTKVRSTPGVRSRISLRAEAQYPLYRDIEVISLASMYGGGR